MTEKVYAERGFNWFAAKKADYIMVIFLLILLRILILQYGIENITITFHDDRKSEGTDNNQKKALKSRMFLENQRCSLKRNGIKHRKNK